MEKQCRDVGFLSRKTPSLQRALPRCDVPEAMTFSILLLRHGEHFLCREKCLQRDIHFLRHNVHFIRRNVSECRTHQLLTFNSSINFLDFHSKTINFMLCVTSQCGEVMLRRGCCPLIFPFASKG